MKRFGYIVNKGKSLVMGDSYFQGPGYSVTQKLQAAYPENDFEVSILKLQGWEKDLIKILVNHKPFPYWGYHPSGAIAFPF